VLLPRSISHFGKHFRASYSTNHRQWPYIHSPKSIMPPQLDSFFKQVDTLSDHFIERLRKAVAIPSVSSDDERRPDVVKMGEWLAAELKALGVEVEMRPLGKQPDKQYLDLPPVVLGRYGNDKSKRTILVYGHYDVQPALKDDGWATEPFELIVDEKDRMYGRGSTDDKGPVLGWLNAIEAHQKAKLDFPVNLLMCFEGMEENGSEGLDEFIQVEAKKYFKDADAVCISDNYWLGTEKPCLTYGLRGCSYYSIELSGLRQDLHSGVYGGSAHEPMTDLVKVMGTLVDSKGKILIPGLNELVAPLTAEEKSLYPDIAFTMENLYESLGSKNSIFESKEETLMARWRYPSLSLHGIEGAFSAPGAKTVIPAKVIGKFSIRTVPNMEPEQVNELVYKYVNDQFAKLGSKNTLKIHCQHAGKWWVASPNHWNFTAAAKAVEQVWGVKPDLTREGGSIPVTLTFEQATGKNVLLLPMGSSTDAAHSINEKLDKKNYIEGIKMLGTYLHYAAEEPMK
jgi:Cys-Gly metallodipeptidase DUG1